MVEQKNTDLFKPTLRQIMARKNKRTFFKIMTNKEMSNNRPNAKNKEGPSQNP